MLSVIIVHYGDEEITKRCIKSIVEKVKGEYEILVWDNSEGGLSFRAGGEVLKGAGGVVRILRSGSNLGYGRAINRAVKFARYERILILNNDTEIIKFRRGAIDLEDGITGSATVDREGRLVNNIYLNINPVDELFKNLRVRAIVDNIKRLSGWSLRCEDREGSKEVKRWAYNVGGHFLLMKREIFEKLGGFDEKYFMYAEEFDLCKRGHLAGYKVIYNPDFRVKHCKAEQTRDSNEEKIVGVRIESKLYYLMKYYSALFIFTLLSNLIAGCIYIIILYIYGKVKGGLKDSRLKQLKGYYRILMEKVIEKLV